MRGRDRRKKEKGSEGKEERTKGRARKIRVADLVFYISW